jgi:hypothetical protein
VSNGQCNELGEKLKANISDEHEHEHEMDGAME